MFPRDAESETFQGLQQSQPSGFVAGNVELRLSELLHDPSARLVETAFFDIKFFHQPAKNILVCPDIVADLAEEFFQPLTVEFFRQMIEQLNRHDRAGEMIVQISR